MAKHGLHHHPDDRCQYHSDREGQCTNIAEPNSVYCKRHGKGLYQLNKWKARVDEIKNDDNRRSISEELAILRLTLENVLNMCDNASALAVNYSQISTLTSQISNLVQLSVKLEKALGLVVSQDELSILASTITSIISEYIKDPDELTEIADRIAAERVSLLGGVDSGLPAIDGEAQP